jgi:hypothetical protein
MQNEFVAVALQFIPSQKLLKNKAKLTHPPVLGRKIIMFFLKSSDALSFLAIFLMQDKHGT